MTTVLVVEDEALVAGDIQRTLVRLGYDVPTTVATGEEALLATSEMKPDIVLMDIKLAGPMDGIATATAIHSRCEVPIVYLTAHSDEATFARAKATNLHGYLLKPFSDRELRTVIEVALHRHELESRLVVRERWFSTTLRSIGDAVIATDSNEAITFLNAVAEKLTGWGQEAVGRPLSEVFRIANGIGESGPSPNIGLVVKTGARLSIDDNTSPIIDDKGSVIGRVVVFRDTTDRQKLEARVAQTERLASLGTMAAGVAHEINNPLAYVVANIELSIEGLQRALKTAGRLSEGNDPRLGDRVVQQLTDLLEGLRDASDGAERVRRIVRDLKKFARSEDPRPTTIDVHHVLDVAIKMTAHAIAHHARVRRSVGTTPHVVADASALGQVFSNLLLNAAQAIGDGHADANEIIVSTFTDADGNAVVEVTDTGPGIPETVLPRLFDPFFTTKEVGMGMGMGLSICHNIVTDLGGHITAENSAAGGATFRVTLPPSTTTAEPAARQEEVVPSKRRGKILVIDDERAVATAMARMLSIEHDVTIEGDGRKACERLVGGESFDLIFCDLMMPNMSGAELYATVLKSDADQAGRIVLMTGGAFSSGAQELLATVPNRQIAKPFTVGEIRSIARDFVR